MSFLLLDSFMLNGFKFLQFNFEMSKFLMQFILFIFDASKFNFGDVNLFFKLVNAELMAVVSDAGGESSSEWKVTGEGEAWHGSGFCLSWTD